MTGQEIEAALRTAYEELDEGLPHNVEELERDYLFGHAMRLILQKADPAELISDALSGSNPAHDALCDVAEEFIATDKPWPRWLMDYLVNVGRNGRRGRPRGRPVKDAYIMLRDRAIVMAVYYVARRHQLHFTRNVVTENECACSIVAKALEEYDAKFATSFATSEATVTTLWQSMGIAYIEHTVAAMVAKPIEFPAWPYVDREAHLRQLERIKRSRTQRSPVGKIIEREWYLRQL